MRALIVEDDLELGRVWHEALSEAGFDVTLVSSCQKAMQHLLRAEFNICLLDLHVADGYTTGLADCIKLRTPETQVIAITGSRQNPYGELSTDHSFDLVFRKPTLLSDLIAVAEHVSKAA